MSTHLDYSPCSYSPSMSEGGRIRDSEPTAEEKISNRIECHHDGCMLRYRLGGDQYLRVLAI